MQIVINIDEEVYKRTLPYKDLPIISNLANDYDEITHAVANGTPLPKGHGRLIDADAVNKEMEEREEKLQDARSMWESSAVSTALDMYGLTIIKADKGESKNP